MGKLSNHQKMWLFILAGIACYAASLGWFLSENKIAAGGVAGIAVILVKFLPVSVGVLTFLFNIPILLAAIFINGWRYTADTLIAAVIYSFAVELFGRMPTLTSDPMVAAVFGGVLYGIGMTFLTIGKGSLGGTDLLCRLINKLCPFLSVPKLVLLIDGGIVVLSMIMFGSIEVGLYAIIALFVCSLVGEKIIYGIREGSICMIVTQKEAGEIAQPLMDTMGRAVTKWTGNGMYSGENRNILMVAIKPKEIFHVKKLLKKIDPEAFITVIPANELIGGNFSDIIADESQN